MPTPLHPDTARSRVPIWLAELGAGGRRGTLAWQAMLSAIGIFLPLSVLALYLTGPAGLSKRQAALCLTVGAVATIAATVPVGRLIGLIGARRYAMWSALARAVLFAMLPLTSRLGWILAVLTLVGAAETASNSIFQIIIADALGEDGRVEAMAIRRTIANVGFTLAAGLTAIVVGSGREALYDAAFLASAAAFVVSAILVSRLPGNRRPPQDRGHASAWVAVRDRRYMSLVGISSFFGTSNALLTVALPLWVVSNTSAPRWSVGMLLAVNTVLVVLLQVRIARQGADLAGARRAVIVSGILFVAAAIAFGAADYGAAVVAVAILCVATVAAALAEMFNSGAWWTISYAMAPARSREEYLAAFDLSTPAVNLVAPSIMVAVVGFGFLGWLGYGALMCLCTVFALPLLHNAAAVAE